MTEIIQTLKELISFFFFFLIKLCEQKQTFNYKILINEKLIQCI